MQQYMQREVASVVLLRRRRVSRASQRRLGLVTLICLLPALLCAESTQAGPQTSPPGWTLTWSDEFDGPDGAPPDPTKWKFDTGGNGWGNKELEYYTARPQNAQQKNGNLVIAAIQETYTGPDKVTRNYTSARLKTAGLFKQAYGRFEARIKIPSGQGLWPAFWMMGSNIGTQGWPACGEIDVMENVGSEPSTVHATIHGPGYSGKNALVADYTISSGHFSDDYHVFAVEWEPNVVRFYVDQTLFSTRTRVDLPAGGRWVFDHPFFVLLNLAVGGKWPGNPNQTTVFPQTMQVDYVRVYARKTALGN